MLKILDSSYVIEFFGLNKPEEFCSNSSTYRWLVSQYDNLNSAIYKWSYANYPHASKQCHQSFANLILYLATGLYNGRYTEKNMKEKLAKSKALEFYSNIKTTLSEKDATHSLIYFIASHILQPAPLEEETINKINEASALLNQSKNFFKSPQVFKAKKILRSIIK